MKALLEADGHWPGAVIARPAGPKQSMPPRGCGVDCFAFASQ